MALPFFSVFTALPFMGGLVRPWCRLCRKFGECILSFASSLKNAMFEMLIFASCFSHLELSVRPSAHLGWTGLDRINVLFFHMGDSLFYFRIMS